MPPKSDAVLESWWITIRRVLYPSDRGILIVFQSLRVVSCLANHLLSFLFRINKALSACYKMPMFTDDDAVIPILASSIHPDKNFYSFCSHPWWWNSIIYCATLTVPGICSSCTHGNESKDWRTKSPGGLVKSVCTDQNHMYITYLTSFQWFQSDWHW